MINKIIDIFGSQLYSIRQIESGIEVYHLENKVISQEKYILLQKEIDAYTVILVTRGERRIIYKGVNEDFAIAYIIILCKKYFEHPETDTLSIRELRNLVDDNKIDEVYKILNEKLNKKYYLIDSQKDRKICLFIKGDKAYVQYNMLEIIADAKLSRGYVVLYNYSRLLEFFDVLYYQLGEKLNIENGYNELSQLYLL